MILGLLSDTHGHIARTEQALEILRNEQAEILFHCGDLGSEEVVSLLFEVQEQGTPVLAVPGNVDEWDPGLILYAKKLGLPLSRTVQTTQGGKTIAVHHGHDPREMDKLTSMVGLNLLFTGHTHVAKDQTIGTVRVINPGAVYRAQVPSVAVLNTETDNCTWIPLQLDS